MLLVVGLGIFGLTQLKPASFPETTSSSGQPGSADARLPKASTPSPLQGSGGTGEDGPRAEGTPGCEKVDRELATALAGELPATGVTGPSPGRACTTGARSAGFQVTDGDRSGFVSATLVPSGIVFSLESGALTVQLKAASGGTLIVSSTPDPGSAPPRASDLHRIAVDLAGHF